MPLLHIVDEYIRIQAEKTGYFDNYNCRNECSCVKRIGAIGDGVRKGTATH